MHKIPLAKLEVGMVIAKDTMDRTGRVLLRQGVQIEDKHFRVLKTWGVTHVFVAEAAQEQAMPVALDMTQYRAIKQQADDRFRHTDSRHPVIRILKAQWVQRRARERATS